MGSEYLDRHLAPGAPRGSDLATIVTFSGKPTEDVYQWINNFEESADLFMWAPNVRLQVARIRFRDSARTWVSTTKVASWEAFKTALIDRFGDKQEAVFTKLTEIYQFENEEVWTYVDRFKALLAKLRTDESPTALRYYFLKGLHHNIFQYVSLQRLEDLEDLMAYAAHVGESFSGRTQPSRQPRPEGFGSTGFRPQPPREPQRRPNHNVPRYYDDRRPQPANPPRTPAGQGYQASQPSQTSLTSNNAIDQLTKQMEAMSIKMMELDNYIQRGFEPEPSSLALLDTHPYGEDEDEEDQDDIDDPALNIINGQPEFYSVKRSGPDGDEITGRLPRKRVAFDIPAAATRSDSANANAASRTPQTATPEPRVPFRQEPAPGPGRASAYARTSGASARDASSPIRAARNATFSDPLRRAAPPVLVAAGPDPHQQLLKRSKEVAEQVVSHLVVDGTKDPYFSVPALKQMTAGLLTNDQTLMGKARNTLDKIIELGQPANRDVRSNAEPTRPTTSASNPRANPNLNALHTVPKTGSTSHIPTRSAAAVLSSQAARNSTHRFRYETTKAPAKVGRYTVTAVIDSGASNSAITQDLVRKLRLQDELEEVDLPFYNADGRRLSCTKILRNVPVTVGHLTMRTDLMVLNAVNYDLLLGNDFLVPAGAMIDLENRKLLYSIDADTRGSLDLVVGGPLRGDGLQDPRSLYTFELEELELIWSKVFDYDTLREHLIKHAPLLVVPVDELSQLLADASSMRSLEEVLLMAYPRHKIWGGVIWALRDKQAGRSASNRKLKEILYEVNETTKQPITLQQFRHSIFAWIVQTADSLAEQWVAYNTPITDTLLDETAAAMFISRSDLTAAISNARRQREAVVSRARLTSASPKLLELQPASSLMSDVTWDSDELPDLISDTDSVVSIATDTEAVRNASQQGSTSAVDPKPPLTHDLVLPLDQQAAVDLMSDSSSDSDELPDLHSDTDSVASVRDMDRPQEQVSLTMMHPPVSAKLDGVIQRDPDAVSLLIANVDGGTSPRNTLVPHVWQQKSEPADKQFRHNSFQAEEGVDDGDSDGLCLLPDDNEQFDGWVVEYYVDDVVTGSAAVQQPRFDQVLPPELNNQDCSYKLPLAELMHWDPELFTTPCELVSMLYCPTMAGGTINNMSTKILDQGLEQTQGGCSIAVFTLDSTCSPHVHASYQDSTSSHAVQCKERQASNM